MIRKVKVVDYDPNWEKQYKKEAPKIKAILGNNCEGIYHIGSTAVKDMKANPVIDIMVVVKKLHMADGKIKEFIDAGYEYQSESGISGQRIYVKCGEEPEYTIRIFEEKDASEIGRHFAIPNYLRTHVEECREYEKLKTELAEKYPEDYEAYTEGKKAYLDALEQKAMDWNIKQSKLGSDMAMGMSLGLIAGCAVGYVLSHMVAGMVIGVMAGLVLGMVIGHMKAGK